MPMTIATNKKNLPFTEVRSAVSSADAAGDISGVSAVPVGDTITLPIHTRFTTHPANCTIQLAMFDRDSSLIGLTPTADFDTSGYRDASGLNCCPRYLYDVGEATMVWPLVTAIDGTANIYIKQM